MDVSNDFERIVLLSDHGSVPLAREIYNNLKKKNLYGKIHEFSPDDIYLNRHNDGECDLKLMTDVRGRHIFVVKSFNTINQKFKYDYNEEKWIKRPELSDLVFQTDNGYMELFA